MVLVVLVTVHVLDLAAAAAARIAVATAATIRVMQTCLSTASATCQRVTNTVNSMSGLFLQHAK